MRENKHRQVRTITYKGVTDTVMNMSRKYGIAESTLAGRIERGWTVERAIEEKASNTFSSDQRFLPTKSDAERWLNERTFEELPICLAKLLPLPVKSKKFGIKIRRDFLPEFDKWYESDFILNHTKNE